jgi:hypothetical protein
MDPAFVVSNHAQGVQRLGLRGFKPRRGGCEEGLLVVWNGWTNPSGLKGAASFGKMYSAIS